MKPAILKYESKYLTRAIENDGITHLSNVIYAHTYLYDQEINS